MRVPKENGKWFEVAIDGPLISNMKDFGVQAAVDGVGIAFASQPLIAPHIAEGCLVALLETWSAPFPGYYLCYPAQRQMAPPLRAVIDAIRAGPAREKWCRDGFDRRGCSARYASAPTMSFSIPRRYATGRACTTTTLWVYVGGDTSIAKL